MSHKYVNIFIDGRAIADIHINITNKESFSVMFSYPRSNVAYISE